MLRSLLLWASQNEWMKQHVPRIYITRQAVKRFMPGKELVDALNAAEKFENLGVGTVFTRLGENITTLEEAAHNTRHYVEFARKIHDLKYSTEISLKLSQIGLDLSYEKTIKNFFEIAKTIYSENRVLWIDMEGSGYTDITIRFYEEIRSKFPRVGLCLQAYLYRTEKDLSKLYQKTAHIRLVKGAYREPATLAFPKKRQVDNNYFKLAKLMLENSRGTGNRVVFGTHDIPLIDRIRHFASQKKFSPDAFEIHMLYGIRTPDQLRLKQEGIPVRILISYGDAWYPWYMRRLAERPANMWFVLKNLFSK